MALPTLRAAPHGTLTAMANDSGRHKGVSARSVAARRSAFLAAYADCGNITAAAAAAGVSRQKHYEWLDDPDYAARFDQTHEAAADALEAEARRRAVEGIDEPVFHNGEVCGYRRRYSDVLLIFLLKGLRPEKFRERHQLDVAATVTSPQVDEALRAVLADPERRRQLDALLDG